MRAEWRGSAGRRILIRCACGALLCLSRHHWQRRSFTLCDDCKAAILYASLEVVNPEDVEEFVQMIISQQEERIALQQDVERELRRFVQVFDSQPEWLWSPATVRFVQAVRPKLELLGGALHQEHASGAAYGAAPEEAFQQEGLLDDELLDQEALDAELLDEEQDADAA